jgi:hypothetical protein
VLSATFDTTDTTDTQLIPDSIDGIYLMVFSAACVVLLSALTVGGDDLEFSISDDPASDEILLVQAEAATPGAAGSSASSNPRTNPNPSSQNRPQQNPYARNARVPNMFGDSLPPASTTFLRTCSVGVQSSVITEVLSGGGSRYSSIGENNRPLPIDRVFFLYNGFFNAATTTDLVAANSFDSNLHRYTIGFEKTYFEGQSSIELRLPFTSSIDLNIGDYSSSTGDIGNLMLITKHLLLKDDDTAIATGIGIGTPTGDDFTAITGNTRIRLNNEAVYLLPYIGWSKTINENWFATAYGQIDIATAGDAFIVEGRGSIGKINAPTYARFDVSLGRWLMQDMSYQYLEGIAAIAEFHYVTTLQDSDTILASDGDNSFALTNVDNRVDYLNTTAGFHFQLTPFSNLRVAGVFPVRRDPDRQFDSELQVAFNRNF